MPSSQASQLPHWSCIAHKISVRHRSPVGAGLPAKAACQSLNIQLNHRYSRQTSSHTFPGIDLETGNALYAQLRGQFVQRLGERPVAPTRQQDHLAAFLLRAKQPLQCSINLDQDPINGRRESGPTAGRLPGASWQAHRRRSPGPGPASATARPRCCRVVAAPAGY